MNTNSKIILAGTVAISTIIASAFVPVGATETKTITRTVTIYALSDNADLQKKVEAICADSSLKLSDKAHKACEAKQFPNLVAKGQRFRNAGIGAEFNTLAAQR